MTISTGRRQLGRIFSSYPLLSSPHPQLTQLLTSHQCEDTHIFISFISTYTTNPHPARLDQVFDLKMAFTTRLVANTHQYAQNLTQDIDLASLSTSKDLALGIVGIVVLLAVFAQWIIKTYKFWQYPFVNKASWWNASKAKENYLWNAQKLLVDGFHQVCSLGLSQIPQMFYLT